MELSFTDWWRQAQAQLKANGLTIPDEDIGDICHMDGMTVDEFVAAIRMGEIER